MVSGDKRHVSFWISAYLALSSSPREFQLRAASLVSSILRNWRFRRRSSASPPARLAIESAQWLSPREVACERL